MAHHRGCWLGRDLVVAAWLAAATSAATAAAVAVVEDGRGTTAATERRVQHNTATGLGV